VTRAHGRNANHALKWRRDFERSDLVDSAVAFTALLSVTAAAPGEAEIRQLAAQQQPAFGSIHIEFPCSGDDRRGVRRWKRTIINRMDSKVGKWQDRHAG